MTRAVTLANLADQNILTADGVNDRVGIGSTQPTTKLDVNGTVTATSFAGDGSNLTGVISGVELSQNGSSVGSAITAINFSGATVSTPTAGLSTVTIAKQLTIGVRVGTAVTFSITGSSFDVSGRSGNVAINV